ncbi:MAG: nucleotide sugar dehydrogenase [Candidatus Solibacter usitatus]|nr:nucleotide sugar dehydrogenase [Candidatus Solibacter usitatus]
MPILSSSPLADAQLPASAQTLIAAIRDRSARVGVVGLGYVGLPLAVEFGKAGFHVTGIDVSQSKVDQINAGVSYIQDVPTAEVAELVAAGRLTATTSFASIDQLDTVNIAVPTPLRKTKDPDMSYVVSAAQAIARHIHPGLLIILESTTYPGTTDELLLPMFEESGLKAGRDFFLCFSPERVDPGNPSFKTRNIPKVVGGITPACTAAGAAFYAQALDTVVPVGSTVTAEMVKLLENTFRMINIGLVNELAVMCHRMNINVWEVIEAAATKPFGFMPFYPGPGLGGHCIPIDPFYLSWKSKQAGIEARFIELAGHINGQMPHFVVSRVQDALNDHSKPLKGSNILVLGIAYKRDIDDVRESPALDVIHLLKRAGASVSYHDPFIPSIQFEGLSLGSVEFAPAAAQADCVVIITDHKSFDYDALVAQARLIVDSRNALKGRTGANIVRL